MQHNEQLISTLNDLIRYNHDRIRGYEKAIEELEPQDLDLQAVFKDKVSQSREFVNELNSIVTSYGGTSAEDSTISGKIYRVWMDFKATVTGQSRKAVLDSCVYGEEAAVEAYEDSLGTEAHLPDNVRKVIVEQKSRIQSNLEKLKVYAQIHEKVG